MSLIGFVRSFRSLVGKVERWYNKTEDMRAEVITGLAAIHRCATYMGDPPFNHRYCEPCGQEHLFALWFDGDFHCLRSLYAMPQAIVKLGCMPCRSTTMHFIGLDGSTHCNPCWAFRAQEMLARRSEALMAAPAPEAVVVMAPAPAARPAVSHRRSGKREEDSFAAPLPS